MDSELSSTHSAPPPWIDKLRDDFICTICSNIFFEPVTISCGHSFCRKCLVVAMDKHKKNCPVCGHWIYISKANFPKVSIVMWNTIRALFPQEVAKRKETSTSNGSQEAPDMIVETGNPILQPDGNTVENSGKEIRPMVLNAVRISLSQPDSKIRPIFHNVIRGALSQPNGEVRPSVIFIHTVTEALSQPDSEVLLGFQNDIRLALEDLCGAFSQPDSEIPPIFHNSIRGALSRPDSEVCPIFIQAVSEALSQPNSEVLLRFQNDIRLALEDLCGAFS